MLFPLTTHHPTEEFKGAERGRGAAGGGVLARDWLRAGRHPGGAGAGRCQGAAGGAGEGADQSADGLRGPARRRGRHPGRRPN
eukprot:9371231-Pyramimonas_sp.AAC.1